MAKVNELSRIDRIRKTFLDLDDARKAEVIRILKAGEAEAQAESKVAQICNDFTVVSKAGQGYVLGLLTD